MRHVKGEYSFNSETTLSEVMDQIKTDLLSKLKPLEVENPDGSMEISGISNLELKVVF
jgi:hypothetical protein